uniref:Mitotic spindle organizing protein 1 n=1 Tax=Felis catus TaxID=9685 RepID=A0ABI7W1W7_FELCA
WPHPLGVVSSFLRSLSRARRSGPHVSPARAPCLPRGSRAPPPPRAPRPFAASGPLVLSPLAGLGSRCRPTHPLLSRTWCRVPLPYSPERGQSAVLLEISRILNTGLDMETLSICVRLCEQGINPEALSSVIKELRKATEALKLSCMMIS